MVANADGPLPSCRYPLAFPIINWVMGCRGMGTTQFLMDESAREEKDESGQMTTITPATYSVYGNDMTLRIQRGGRLCGICSLTWVD